MNHMFFCVFGGVTLEKIRIKGLRSLTDTGYVNIKPINILVGTNSSGKSTFLRVFPLMRQSVKRRTRGPILWNGTFTDFESFSTSVHNDNSSVEKNDSMSFSFVFNFDDIGRRNTKGAIELVTTICIREGGNRNSCYTHKYSIKIGEHEINFSFEESGKIISIISSRLSWELSRRELNFQRTDTDSMLPVIKLPGYNHQFMHEKKEISGVLYSQIKNLIGEHTGSGSEKKIIQMTNAILSQMRLDEDKLNFMRSIKSTKKWNELLSSWTVSDSDFIFLSGLIDLFSIIENSFMINNKLGSCFKNVRYIAPLRASTERYYRYQDLSVDEIDHKGENIGMFLSNIPKKWRDGLDDWTSNNLGFKIKEQMTSSHIAIKLEYGDESVLDNIADMGFGFSQIMPIVVQLWSVASGYEANIKGFNVDPYIFAIE